MIKNIIFDLGNVLISFRPSEYFDKKGYPEVIKKTILTDIFGSKEWLLLDDGQISTREAIASIASRSTMSQTEISHIFNLRTDLMFPIDSNVRVLPALKKQGYKLYFLSNFPLDIFDEVKSGYFFFRYFDGGLISAEVKISKPDPGIYKLLLENYSLRAEESVYIDDIEANVRAAEKLGMKGIFTAGSLKISEYIDKILPDDNNREN